MADIFREIEEDVRREQWEKIWKQYRDHIIAAVALVIIGVAGFQLYRVYEQREANKASIGYEAAAQLLESGQPRAAEPQLAALAKSAPGGYARLAQLAQADALFGAGDHNAAIGLYKKIANGGDPYFSAVARLHAAWAIADGASRPELANLLAPLSDPTNAWHSLAQEVLAYADLRAGNVTAALKSYRHLATDPNAPSSLHTRAAAMVRFIDGGGAVDYGHVPRPKALPAKAPAPPAAKGPPTR
ncbi:MAG: tetratricopeptide repeat protein [Rhizomicrobium sp.]